MDEEKKTLTLHVEWVDSHLLYHTKYHRLDEASSRQKHQMWREIMALQAENYALEKQVFSYQQSIAKIGSKTNLHELGLSKLVALPDIDGAPDPLVISEAVDITPRDLTAREIPRDRDYNREVEVKSDVRSERSRTYDRSGSRRKSKRDKSEVDYRDATDEPAAVSTTPPKGGSASSKRSNRDRYDHYGRYDNTKDGKYDFGRDGKYEDTRNGKLETRNGKYDDGRYDNGAKYETKYATDAKYAADSKYGDAKYVEAKADLPRGEAKYVSSSRRGSKYDATKYDSYDDYDRYDDYDCKVVDAQYSDRYSDYDQSYDRASLDRESNYDLSPYDRSTYSRNSYDRY